MKVADLLWDTDFKCVVLGNDSLKITDIYSSDLLSWVLSHAKINNAWCTVLTHVNIIAIAALLQLSCVIICEDAEIDNATIEKATKEKINLFQTKLNSVEVIRKFNHEMFL